jgi:hypothetical protein
MADKSMKSTIQVAMDTSGVVKGVAATNKELDKLNRTARRTATATSMTAALGVAQAGFGALQGIISAINNRVDELNQLAFKFSPEAAAARGQLTAAQMQADVAVGQALGAGAAASAREQQFRVEERAARVIEQAPDMNAATAMWTSLWETTKSMFGQTVDQALIEMQKFTDKERSSVPTLAGGQMVADFVSGLASVVATPFESAGAGTLYTGEGFSLGGSTRGMMQPDQAGTMDRMARSLDNIDRKLGGS